MLGFYSSQAGAIVRWLDLPGRGDPVVFIHGLGCASTYDYPRVAADPALAGRRMILVDLPGFGYSDKPESFGYRIGDQAGVVVELLDRLGLERCYLYGHSMGAASRLKRPSGSPDGCGRCWWPSLISIPGRHVQQTYRRTN